MGVAGQFNRNIQGGIMNKSKHVYVTYILTTPGKIWQAITERNITRQYWVNENVSDWKPGSDWKHLEPGNPPTVMLVGKVIESTPPNRLVISWADSADVAKPEKHSRVTFDIEPIEDMVRLTVTHDDLEPNSEMERGIDEGWPRVLSSMKSFLETGRALKVWAGKDRPARRKVA
jgi:uncharacterized protein YndB with AHSA1/START domain